MTAGTCVRLFGDPGTANTGWAEFSPCERYRYVLGRQWNFIGVDGDGAPLAHPRFTAFIGLNPSTATAEKDDPTIRRCIGFAKRWGSDGLLMLNAYAYRSTDPKGLKRTHDPMGPENWTYLRAAMDSAQVERIVCAWGVNCPIEHQVAIKAMANQVKRTLYCLGVTGEHRPRHPLYIQKTVEPQPWQP